MSEAAAEAALVLAGRYALSDHIAEGGMAVVWRGLDLRLHRDVAIKVLTKRDDSDRDRVVREARLLAATPHPNIVQVLDVGVDDDRPYIVMELLEGMGLDRALARGPVTTLEALEIATQALDGLSVVHTRGIVHRDLKPSNLFLARDPGSLDPRTSGLLAGKRVKILDFGVSRTTERTASMKSPLTTRDGALVGTPEYMAPEQARGLPEIGPAADLYAIGVILFECFTQTLPFESPNAGDLIIAIATQPPPKLAELRPDLPASLTALVDKALAKKPEDRFESALAMRRVIEAIRAEVEGSGASRISYEALIRAERESMPTLDGEDVSPARSSVRETLPIQRSPWLPLAAGLAVVALGVAAFALTRGDGATPPAPTIDVATPAATTEVPSTPTEAATPTSDTEQAPVAIEPRTDGDAGPAATIATTTPEPATRGAEGRSTDGTGREPRTTRPGGRRTGSASTEPATTDGTTPRFRDLDY